MARSKRLAPTDKIGLVLMMLLDMAESGGMTAEDCGAVYQACTQCFSDAAKNAEELMENMSILASDLQRILEAEKWSELPM